MPAEPHPRDVLRKSCLFHSLSDDPLALLEANLTLVQFAAGDYLCREGEPGDRLFIIASGRVTVLKAAERGAPVEVTVLEPGEAAGMMSLFDDDVRSATLRAREPVSAWVIGKTEFQGLLARHPELARNLLAHLSRHLRSTTLGFAQGHAGIADSRLRVAYFDAKPYGQVLMDRLAASPYAVRFLEPRLGPDTAALAANCQVVCAFVNDRLDRATLALLAELGVEFIALRCAGYNNVDLEAAVSLGLSVTRVPAYSPYAVAEHAVALMLTLNRKIHRAYARVRDGNFSLNGLVGFDLHGRTAGVVGVGTIGKCLVNILSGFGMKVLGYDRNPDSAFAENTGLLYVPLDELFANADIISLHAPLLPATRHLINAATIARMKPGVMLINTSRGALVDAAALIEGLKSGRIGAAGLDVYEEEEHYFFQDLSTQVITDDLLARLLTFNNVVITSHQAFLTQDALINIADAVLRSIEEFAAGKRRGQLTNAVLPPARQ